MWNIANARRWLENIGHEHLEDGLRNEGEMLLGSLDESVSEARFRGVIRDSLWWHEVDIDHAVIEVKMGKGPASDRYMLGSVADVLEKAG
jgi:hypothetical protein